jgi:hypothetical protein
MVRSAAVAALVVAGLAGGDGRAAAASTWSIVQSRGVLTVANTALTVNFGSLPVTGDKIIVGFDLLKPSGLAVADRNGVALRRVASAGTSFLYEYNVPASPSRNIQITWSHPATISANGLEVSGLGAGDDVDGTPGTLTGSTSPTGSPSYVSGATGELLYSFYGNNARLVRATQPSGWTLDPNSVDDSGAAQASAAYTNSTGGHESSPWSYGPVSGTWSVITVAFQ